HRFLRINAVFVGEHVYLLLSGAGENLIKRFAVDCLKRLHCFEHLLVLVLGARQTLLNNLVDLLLREGAFRRLGTCRVRRRIIVGTIICIVIIGIAVIVVVAIAVRLGIPSGIAVIIVCAVIVVAKQLAQ